MFPPIALLALLACLTAIIPTAAPAPASAIPTPASYLILSADVSQPWSGIQGTNPEQWNFTIAGQWPGSKPVSCSLAWNAGAANVTDEAQHVVDVTFNNCTDPCVTIDMTRFRVEPWFLWQLTVAARGFNSAVWRMKNMYETAGWTTSQGATAWHFAGGAGHPISGAPSGTLEDCLRLNTCVSN